ncbi:MAG: hypothetical protein ACFFB0_21455 [Promethearchaeota archaeon]
MTLEDKKKKFPYICSSCGELYQAFNKYCEKCGTSWSIMVAADADYEKDSTKRKRISIPKEEVRKGLTYSLVAIVVTFFLALFGLNYLIPNSTGIFLTLTSLTFMTVGIVSLIIYFVNPEISYGMWISRKKSKYLDNRNVLVGRRIVLVITIIGLCVSTFVFIIIINALL